MTTKTNTTTALQNAMNNAVEGNKALEVSVVEVFKLAIKAGDLATAKQVFAWIGDMHAAVHGKSDKRVTTITDKLAIYAAHCVTGCEFYIGKGKNAVQIKRSEITPENAFKVVLRPIDGESPEFKAPTKCIDKESNTVLTWQPDSYNRKPSGWNGTGGNTAAYNVDKAAITFAKTANKKGFANDLLNASTLLHAVAEGADMPVEEIRDAWLESMLQGLSAAKIKELQKAGNPDH